MGIYDGFDISRTNMALKILIRAYSFIINKVKRSLYILLEKDDKISNKYCIVGLTFQSSFSNLLWKVSSNIQYLLEILSSFSNKMYKFLFTLFITTIANFHGILVK